MKLKILLLALLIMACQKETKEIEYPCDCESVLVLDSRGTLPSLVEFNLRACELNQDKLDTETYNKPYATTLSGEQASLLVKSQSCK